MRSMKNAVVRGVAWSAVERFGRAGCGFVVQLVLARLLLPAEFGLIAMVAVFVSICSAIVDSGFANAVIQKQDLTEADCATAFIFNGVVGLAAALALWMAAPAIAGFYEQPAMVPVVRWLALSVVLGSVGGLPRALLTRRLAFKRVTAASIPAVLVSGVVGIAMALAGCGVWALVGQMLVQQGLGALLLWWQSRWWPRHRFSRGSFRAMFGFGSKLALSSLLDTGFGSIYVLIIGRFFSPAEVGFFQRAQAFQQLPAANVQGTLSRVFFPAFSQMQGDPARLRNAMARAIQLGSLLMFPGMALLAALASPLVVALIGEKWLPAVAMLQPLCVLGALYPLHAVNLDLLMGLGRSDAFLKLEIIKKALIVINVAVTYHWGVMPMIYGMVVSSVLALGINTYYAHKLIGYGFWPQVKSTARVTAVAVVVLAATGGLVHFLPLSPWPALVLGGALGGVILLLGLRFMEAGFRHEIKLGLRQLLPGPLQGLARLA